MNIKLTATTLIILSTTAALSNEGAYVGGFLGHNNFRDEFAIRSTEHSKKVKNTEHNLGYGLFAGYGKKINDFYVGIEAGLSNGYPNKRHSMVGQRPHNPEGWKYQKGVVMSISPRVGYFINSEYMVYSKLGIERSKDKAIHYLYNLRPMSYSKTVTNLVPGVGIEKVSANTSVRLEYSRDFGKKITMNKGLALGYTNQQTHAGYTVKI